MDENSIFSGSVDISAITYPNISSITVGKKDLQTQQIKTLELNHCDKRPSFVYGKIFPIFSKYNLDHDLGGLAVPTALYCII